MRRMRGWGAAPEVGVVAREGEGLRPQELVLGALGRGGGGGGRGRGGKDEKEEQMRRRRRRNRKEVERGGGEEGAG